MSGIKKICLAFWQSNQENALGSMQFSVVNSKK